MEKVILFGAGGAGKHFILNQQEFTIIAVADNDEKKFNTLLEGIKIINPKEISKYDYDKVIVTSMYFNPIQKQLVNECMVKPNQIQAANKNLLKETMYPFEHNNTLNYANKSLLKLVDFLEKEQLSYFLDFGTLLGVVRDKELIRWDDDIDVTCYLEDKEKIVIALEKFIALYSDDTKTWQYKLTKHLNGNDSSFVLTFSDELNHILPFSIDIWLLYFEEDTAVQTMNKCAMNHFSKAESVNYKGKNIHVPYDFKAYLHHTYGDWKTPKKDTTFADYPFAFEI